MPPCKLTYKGLGAVASTESPLARRLRMAGPMVPFVIVIVLAKAAKSIADAYRAKSEKDKAEAEARKAESEKKKRRWWPW